MGLDTVELVLALEETFGISISDAEAQTMFTTRQVVERIYLKVRSNLPEDNGCLSMRAFFLLRQAFQSQGIPRGKVKPDAKVSALLPGRRRRDLLCAVMERAGFLPLKQMPFILFFTFGHLRDIIAAVVIKQHDLLRLPGCGWSKAQVREVVRAVMYAQLALRRFSDDARIVDDLGIE